MSTVHETIYPVLPAEPGAAELKVAFTPSAAEIRFVRRQSRQEASAVLIMVQLKLLQRLGYFPMLVDVPPVIIDHIRSAMQARALSRAAIARYDVSGTRIRHQKLLRRWLDIRAFDASETAWLTELASAEVRTKIELPDLINVLIEELVRRRYELPPLATLQRIATQARNDFNEAIYGAIAGAPLRRNPPTLQTRMLSTGKPALGLCRTEKIMSGDELSSSAPQPVIFGRSRKLNRVTRHNQEG